MGGSTPGMVDGTVSRAFSSNTMRYSLPNELRCSSLGLSVELGASLWIAVSIFSSSIKAISATPSHGLRLPFMSMRIVCQRRV